MVIYIIMLVLSSINSHRALFYSGQVEKRYKDGSSEIRLPNGSVRYFDPKNEHVREEWRFPDGAALTVSASGEQRIVFSNGQVEVHTKDHKVSHSFVNLSGAVGSTLGFKQKFPTPQPQIPGFVAWDS